jgi:hypothetical protein
VLWLAASAAVLPACLAADGPGSPDQADPVLGVTDQQIAVGTNPVTDMGIINTGGDVYRHLVDVLYGGNCVFQTSLITMPDTTMTLLNVNNVQMAFNDDSGGTLASRIQMLLVLGRYFVDVRGFLLSQTGSWNLTVTCTDPVMFLSNFVANGDPGQCGGATGFQISPMGAWSSSVVIDADDRSGWCEQQFGVSDPTGALAGLSMSVNFFGNGDANQCVSSGLHSIPVGGGQLSSPIGINTDSRAGGCWQVFSLAGRSDVVLDVEFLATGNGQCGNTGTFTVSQSSSASFLIDTDGRAGGCSQRFRLRRP